MFPALRSRWDAMILVRALRQSLLESKDRWKTRPDDTGGAVLSHGEFRIVLEPRGPRLLDAVHLYRSNAEVWLPLLPRLRLRAAARLRLIQDAKSEMEGARPSRKSGAKRPTRTA